LIPPFFIAVTIFRAVLVLVIFFCHRCQASCALLLSFNFIPVIVVVEAVVIGVGGVIVIVLPMFFEAVLDLGCC